MRMLVSIQGGQSSKCVAAAVGKVSIFGYLGTYLKISYNCKTKLISILTPLFSEKETGKVFDFNGTLAPLTRTEYK
jgi:hypothetical protein